jgi:hypothetical protein
MFKKLQEKWWILEAEIGKIRSNFYNKKMKALYPDYEDDAYNCGSLKFVYGVKSYDDLTGQNCSFYTMNDFDIYYDRDTKLYSLGIETAYGFEEPRKQNECKYLEKLLKVFTKYMDENKLDKNFDLCLFCMQPEITNKAGSIEELYAKFKMFVLGYCALYNYNVA